MTRRLLLAATPLLGVLAACAPDAPMADLAIRNVTVIDAVNGVREARTVVIDGGAITAVTTAGETADAVETVDGTGHYLIPGLWDFHVHLTYDARLTEAMPGLFLHHGITSIRDTGGPLERVVPVVDAMRADGAVAPRVFFAGPLLDGADVVYDGRNQPLLGIANPDVETARSNVAALADAGVDFLKIYEMVQPEVFRALVEEARARGLPIDGHVPLSMRARDVGLRVQSLEHLRNLELDCAAEPEALVAARRRLLANPDGLSGGRLRSAIHSAQRLPAVAAYDETECAAVLAAMASTIQVPTLRLNAMDLRPPFARADWSALLDKLPSEVASDWAAAGEARTSQDQQQPDTPFADWSLSLVGMLHEAGVPIGAGTDTPIGFAAPGYSLHSELEMLVQAGLTPMEALEAATIRPAEFFDRADEMGTVEAGRLADLVLLAANPLDDITNTRTVRAVVSKGALLTREELDALVGRPDPSVRVELEPWRPHRRTRRASVRSAVDCRRRTAVDYSDVLGARSCPSTNRCIDPFRGAMNDAMLVNISAASDQVGQPVDSRPAELQVAELARDAKGPGRNRRGAPAAVLQRMPHNSSRAENAKSQLGRTGLLRCLARDEAKLPGALPDLAKRLACESAHPWGGAR